MRKKRLYTYYVQQITNRDPGDSYGRGRYTEWVIRSSLDGIFNAPGVSCGEYQTIRAESIAAAHRLWRNRYTKRVSHPLEQLAECVE